MNPADLFDHDPEPVVLKEGDALFHEGSQPDFAYVLLQGTADVLVGDRVVESATKGGCSARWLSSTPARVPQRSSRPRLADWQKSTNAVSNSWVQQTPNFATL